LSRRLGSVFSGGLDEYQELACYVTPHCVRDELQSATAWVRSARGGLESARMTVNPSYQHRKVSAGYRHRFRRLERCGSNRVLTSPDVVGAWIVKIPDAPFPLHMFVFHSDGTVEQSNPDAGDPNSSDSNLMGAWRADADGYRGKIVEITADRTSRQFAARGEISFALKVSGIRSAARQVQPSSTRAGARSKDRSRSKWRVNGCCRDRMHPRADVGDDAANLPAMVIQRDRKTRFQAHNEASPVTIETRANKIRAGTAEPPEVTAAPPMLAAPWKLAASP
jgi:hypothetical protein